MKNKSIFGFSLLAASLLLSYSFIETTTQQPNQVVAESDLQAINDGPYIFYSDKGLVEKNIIDGKVEEKTLSADAFPSKFKPDKSIYKKVDKIAALSDIHGQYDLMLDIFKNNKIIDNNLKWSFGNGHLVIVGDIFDRGPKVTEILWFIFDLEKQALEQGGMVHYLLGNHEYMVMQNDLRYINKKYQNSATLLGVTYQELFNDQTVLGRWLRSKNTVVRINDNLFVHGGISAEFVQAGFNPSEVNNLMRKSIDMPKDKMDPVIQELYFGYYGPIWYRGYFEDNLAESRIDSILTATNVKHIVVGHTSQERIEQLYNNKIFAVDSSIKLGNTGEILMISNDRYTRCTQKGDPFGFD